MPYRRIGKCVYKKNPDGSLGENVGCSDTEDMAEAHMRALYAREEDKAKKPMMSEEDMDSEHEDGMMSDEEHDPKKKKTKKEMMMKSFSVSFKQDSNGQWWFLGKYSNKFKDRDNEILSEASHEDFVDWLKETGVKPQITLFHQPQKPGFWSIVMKAYELGLIKTKTLNALMRDFYKEYAIAETERVMYANGFTIVVGKVYQDRIPQIKAMENIDLEWGMSHGFVPVNKHGNIFEKYRSFEFSVLPKSRAANWWTEAQFREVTEVALTEEDKNLLDQIQPGLAEEVENGTADKAAELTEAGVDFKEVGEQVEETPAVEETTPVEEAAPAPEGDKALEVNALLETLKVALNLDGLVEAIKAELKTLEDKIDTQVGEVNSRLKAVEQSEDDKIASVFSPLNLAKAFAAATSPEPNEVAREDDKAKKEALKGWEEIQPNQIFWGNTFK